MAYIGNPTLQVAFVTDQFSGTGSQTTYTMSVAPANTASVLVSVHGVVQDPTTYAVLGTTLTFSQAPPAGTGNISCRYLGIPASGVNTTAYRTVTDYTATSGQTTFTVPSYTVGYIDVYRNGVKLGLADFTATSGTTVVLANACTAGDLVETVSFYVSSVLNAIPAVAGAVNSPYLAANLSGVTLASPQITSGSLLNSSGRPMIAQTGGILQIVNGTYNTITTTTSSSYVSTTFSTSITPTSSSSKILVSIAIPGYVLSTGGQLTVTIYRNATDLSISGGAQRGFGQIYSGAGALQSTIVATYLDSPSTTSSTTYTIYYSSTNLASTVGICPNNVTATMTLMEIAQ